MQSLKERQIRLNNSRKILTEKGIKQLEENIRLGECDLIDFKKMLPEIAEDDIREAIIDSSHDMVCFKDLFEMGKEITVNNDPVEWDSDLNFTVDGYFMPEYIFDMLQEGRFKDAMFEIEKRGL
jgi:hypothetical protein